MLPNYDDFLIRRFEHPDEVRTFEKGKFETVKIGSMTIGRASYEPGWKWSEHVGAATGAKFCEVEHVGLVVSGCAACQMQEGRYYEMKAGDLFYIASLSWSGTLRAAKSLKGICPPNTPKGLNLEASFFGVVSRVGG
jgi:hypothetical protein